MRVPNRILPRKRFPSWRFRRFPITLFTQPWAYDPFSVFFRELPTGSLVRRLNGCGQELTLIVTRVFTRLVLMVESDLQVPLMDYEADVVLYDKTFDAGHPLPLNYRIPAFQVLGVDFTVYGSPSVIPPCCPTIWYER